MRFLIKPEDTAPIRVPIAAPATGLVVPPAAASVPDAKRQKRDHITEVLAATSGYAVAAPPVAPTAAPPTSIAAFLLPNTVVAADPKQPVHGFFTGKIKPKMKAVEVLKAGVKKAAKKTGSGPAALRPSAAKEVAASTVTIEQTVAAAKKNVPAAPTLKSNPKPKAKRGAQRKAKVTYGAAMGMEPVVDLTASSAVKAKPVAARRKRRPSARTAAAAAAGAPPSAQAKKRAKVGAASAKGRHFFLPESTRKEVVAKERMHERAQRLRNDEMRSREETARVFGAPKGGQIASVFDIRAAAVAARAGGGALGRVGRAQADMSNGVSHAWWRLKVMGGGRAPPLLVPAADAAWTSGVPIFPSLPHVQPRVWGGAAVAGALGAAGARRLTGAACASHQSPASASTSASTSASDPSHSAMTTLTLEQRRLLTALAPIGALDSTHSPPRAAATRAPSNASSLSATVAMSPSPSDDEPPRGGTAAASAAAAALGNACSPLAAVSPADVGSTWAQASRPMCRAEVCGNEVAIDYLMIWMQEWKIKMEGIQRRARARAKKLAQLVRKGSAGGCKSGKKGGKKGRGEDAFAAFAARRASPKSAKRKASIWDEEDSDDDVAERTGLVLCGPVGSGKTSAVFALAAENGFNVIEINCSDHRSRAKVLSKCEEATQVRVLLQCVCAPRHAHTNTHTRALARTHTHAPQSFVFARHDPTPSTISAHSVLTIAPHPPVSTLARTSPAHAAPHPPFVLLSSSPTPRCLLHSPMPLDRMMRRLRSRLT